ncbi:hypothetical protein HGA92_01185 [Candidatus Gracilibacteria bacterium]|nr:hypothetical protein [Candidatus Gracilibacteria bacterium]NUJ98777.1 hypothetical protein [Candidatus Gracilibacteria bacterium]
MDNYQQMDQKIKNLKKWFGGKNWKEGEDYIILSYREVDKHLDPKKKIPVESRLFAVSVHESKYKEFKEYLENYIKELNIKHKPEYEGQKAGEIGYSWQGRVYVAEGNTHFETTIMTDIKTLEFNSYHNRFKKFFKKQTGLIFPSAEKINGIIVHIYSKGLDLYENSLSKLESLRKKIALTNNKKWQLDKYISGMKLYIQIIKGVGEDGNKIVEMPEKIKNGKFSSEMMRFNDLTYNAYHLIDLSEVMKETGISIPSEFRIDKLFGEKFDFKNMKQIVKDFSDKIMEDLDKKYGD